MYLSDMGLLSRDLQLKLLDLIYTRSYCSLGSGQRKSADVRLVFSMRTKPGFSEKPDGSLLAKIQNYQINIPSLSERQEDIPGLARLFLQDFYRGRGISASLKIDDEVINFLRSYPFKGNLRQMRSLIYEAASIRRENRIRIKDILPILRNDYLFNPEELSRIIEKTRGDNNGSADNKLLDENGNLPTIKDAMRKLVIAALEETDGHQRAAAKILGLSPPALNSKINSLGIREHYEKILRTKRF